MRRFSKATIICLIALGFWAAAAARAQVGHAIGREAGPEVEKGVHAFEEWLRSFRGHVSGPVRTGAVQYIIERCAISGKDTAAATSFGQLTAVAARNVASGPKATFFAHPSDEMVLGQLNATRETGFFRQQRITLRGDVLQVRPLNGSAGADMSMPQVRGVFADAAQKMLSLKSRPLVAPE